MVYLSSAGLPWLSWKAVKRMLFVVVVVGAEPQKFDDDVPYSLNAVNSAVQH